MKKKTNHPNSGDKKSKRTKKDENTSGSGLSKSKPASKNYPGYPPYPATEDIFNNKKGKLELDEEEVILRMKNLPPSRAERKSLNSEPIKKSRKSGMNEKKPATESDVTPEEIKLLDSGNLNADGGDDDQLRKRVTPVDMSGEDLDVPGSELDDADEAIGEEDEENNPYSIGGDRHDDLEEDPQ